MNPLTCFSRWFNYGQDQGDQIPLLAKADETTIRDLPIEVRVIIWEYLSIKDHQAIRQLCKQFKSEIDQIVGVHAILFGPQPQKANNFAETLISLCKPNPEIIRVEENIEWITNSAVRSLTLSQFNGMTFDPSTMITNEHILRRLVVQLEKDLTPKVKVTDILNRCKNMNIIDIYCFYDVEQIHFTNAMSIEVCEPYRKEAVEFSKDILQSLLSKPNLKEFTLFVLMRRLRDFRFAKHTFMRILNEPSDEPRIPINYPSTIQKLDIRFPILKNMEPDRSQLRSWKDLLDQQKQLIELTVQLGFLHWTYFSNVIRNNVKTLRKLNLQLGNWKEIQTEEDWLNDAPVTDQLDWTNLLPDTLNLTALKIVMSNLAMLMDIPNPHRTRNLRNLKLQGLTDLTLDSVAIDPEDFVWIFSKLPSLMRVCLDQWSSTDLEIPEADLIEIARTSFLPIFHALLRSNQIEQIKLWDVCFSECPKYLCELINALPNYKTEWPKAKAMQVTVVDNVVDVHVEYTPLVIQRNPEAELIQPNMFNLP